MALVRGELHVNMGHQASKYTAAVVAVSMEDWTILNGISAQ